MVFDEREEMKRIEVEKAAGKVELVGNLLVNKPVKIIGTCKDIDHDELVYLVAFEPGDTEVYLPVW
eukprot:CAMPEP_0185567644 /NCGR_PEP_ID=MMETSP0434-20130131/843_1 /TAXON_ID=626734 ORGANISM="Favella taraikaensis, Strain Fe Narragansett Bay" /NCGR_SAMPLE_ID=MMETSP0434 /ASSEMBLY_ACC=CAM_ASM_000379 /LENGTH=65 /DNA_ID=CAMNT_0028181913 /DNA_START=1257 /DNA_END=1451 /DNA_ORIENTATION=-